MLITKEYVDELVPKHTRTSCSDSNISNAYGGWNGRYCEKTGRKKIIHPRCNRCYLLDNIGIDTDDLEFKIVRDVFLEYKGE